MFLFCYTRKAKIKDEDLDSDSDEDLEDSKSKKSKKGGKHTSSSTSLKSELRIVRLKQLNQDANGMTNLPTDIIRSIKFHPKYPVALVADSRDEIGIYKVFESVWI